MRTSLILLFCLVPSLAAQEEPWKSAQHVSTRVPRAELDAISSRGREIAAYDAAAWHGTDAVLALHPASDRVRGYLARRRADGLWEVVFGRPNTAADTFYVAYRAVQTRPGSQTYDASVVEPVQGDTGYYARASRAQTLAAKDFGKITRPYNNVVLPVPDSAAWYVYLMPAPTRAGYWPLGADSRYRISADGREIREVRRLHNTVIEYGPLPSQGGAQPEAEYHTAVLFDRPQDTDVFLVLTREPKLPEYVVSKSFYFRIDVDGRITAFDREGDEH